MTPARLAHWLGLAAAPTFAVMGVATGLRGTEAGAVICGSADAPLGGMAVMYLLMSGFHLAPWLRLGRARRLSSH